MSRFGLFWFYDISTIVGYLMLNPVYTYISNMYMIGKYILEIAFLNKPELFLALSKMASRINNSHN